MEKLLKAYAKINLFLDCVKKKDNGYHDLNMVMIPLELHDLISVEEVGYLRDDYITCDHVELQETQFNLISITLRRMREEYGASGFYNVMIHKEIPISAGLGGGSSNGAAIIHYIDKHKKLNLSINQKLEFGKTIGCDVPFCLIDKPAHVTGEGENVEPIEMKKDYYVIIIKPTKGCSTKKVFALGDTMELEHSSVDGVIEALKNGDDDLLQKSLFNSLEKPATELVPEINDVKAMLKNDGFKLVLMSGSGSSVFALTSDRRFAQKMYRKYDRQGYNVILTKTLR